MKKLHLIVFGTILCPAIVFAMENRAAHKKNYRRKQDYAEQRTIIKRPKKEQQIIHQIEEETCPVCLEDLKIKAMRTLSCHPKHQFHEACLREWRKRSDLCPYGCPSSRMEYLGSLGKKYAEAINNAEGFEKVFLIIGPVICTACIANFCALAKDNIAKTFTGDSCPIL